MNQQKPLNQDRQNRITAATYSEAFLEMMIESAKDYAIFALDLNRDVIYWSSGAERMFGYTEAEMIGQPGDMVFTPEDRLAGVPASEMAMALQQGFAQDDRWHMRKDGVRIFVSGMSRVMLDSQGAPQGFIKVARDLTERVRIETAEREQRGLAEALRETASAINASLDLPEVLALILENVRRVVGYDVGYIILFDEQQHISQVLSRGYQEHGLGDLEEALGRFQNPFEALPQWQNMMASRQPVIISDTYQCLPNQWRDPFQSGNIRAFAGIPIISQERLLGFLNLHSLMPEAFGEGQIERLTAFATQAALAIRNAQLHEMAQQTAASGERRRLSRDLHDSVTQMLFASSVLASTLPYQLNNPEKLLKSASDLERLNRGALAEMRGLLRELRRNDITSVSLQELLNQLAQIAMGNNPVTIEVVLDANPTLPPDVHEAFYRITQEALNNITKHAHAQNAEINLRQQGGQVVLVIKDNGRGFDPQQISPNSLGLGIIQERTNAIGASLEIKSQPGKGTGITIHWPKPE